MQLYCYSVSLASFATITLRVASQVYIIISIYFVIDSVQKLWIHPCITVKIYSNFRIATLSFFLPHDIVILLFQCFVGHLIFRKCYMLVLKITSVHVCLTLFAVNIQSFISAFTRSVLHSSVNRWLFDKWLLMCVY
jgi:hypothetical protein